MVIVKRFILQCLANESREFSRHIDIVVRIQIYGVFILKLHIYIIFAATKLKHIRPVGAGAVK